MKNFKKEVNLAGFENFIELLKALKLNGELIDELPYSLRYNSEVILAALCNYPQAIKYIDKDFCSDAFLEKVLLTNLETFIELKPRITKTLFKIILKNIVNISLKIENDKIKDNLCEIWNMFPIEYIYEFSDELRNSKFYGYYDNITYLKKFINKTEDVMQRAIAFEIVGCYPDNFPSNNVGSISIIIFSFVRDLGFDYYNFFAKYLIFNYSVEEVLDVYCSTDSRYKDNKIMHFMLNYIILLTKSTNVLDVLNVLYSVFDSSERFNSYFHKEERVVDYFAMLLDNVAEDKTLDIALFADKLFIFILKNGLPIEIFKLLEMFKDYIHYTDELSGKSCKHIDEIYDNLVYITTDKEEIEFLETLIK